MEGEEALRNRVTSGFKSAGTFFKMPPATPKRPFVSPDSSIAAKAHAKPTTSMPTKK